MTISVLCGFPNEHMTYLSIQPSADRIMKDLELVYATLRARSHSPSTTCCAKTVLRVASLLWSIPRRSVKSHAWPKHVYFITQHVARRLVTVGDCCETAL